MFMFAFGVSTQSLMFGNQKLDDQLLRQIFFPAFFIIGGEYYTRGILYASTEYPSYTLSGTPQYCATDGSTPGIPGYYNECPDQLGAKFSLFLYVVYMIFLNILLVNLVIAIFK